MTSALRIAPLSAAGLRAAVGLVAIALFCAASVHAQQSAAPMCAPAAAACFAGCPLQTVRTSNGSCVPKALAALPSEFRPLHVGVVAGQSPAAVLPSTAAAVPAPASAPAALEGPQVVVIVPAAAPEAPSCCMGELRVELSGWQNLGGVVKTQALEADVSINGQIVGKTPFVESLPLGDYLVQVTMPGALAHAAVVSVRSATSMLASGELELTLNAEQAQARSAWRTARASAANAQLVSAYRAALSAYAQDADPIVETRSDLRTGAIIAGASGLVAVGVSIGLLTAASAADDDAHEAFGEWNATLDATKRAPLAERVDDAQRKRDLYQAFGYGSLVVGLGGLATAVVLLLKMPASPSAAPGAPALYTTPVATLDVLPGAGHLALRLRM